MSEISDGAREAAEGICGAIANALGSDEPLRDSLKEKVATLIQRLAVAPVEAERDTYAGRLAVLRLERDEARAELDKVSRRLADTQHGREQWANAYTRIVKAEARLREELERVRQEAENAKAQLDQAKLWNPGAFLPPAGARSTEGEG